MTVRKPLLIQKDRREIGRIPARDFLTPVLRWSGAPSQVELIDISMGGLSLEYAQSGKPVKGVFKIDLETPDGFTVTNLPFERLSDETIATTEGKFDTRIRGRFLELADAKLKQLKKIVYYSYQHYLSRTAPAVPPREVPDNTPPPPQTPVEAQAVSEGVVPICASCKRIRDPQGTWHTVETYIRSTRDVNFTHSICPHCAPKMYPWIDE